MFGKAALVVAATGSGKTTAAHLIADAYLSQGGRLLWIAAQDELVYQPAATCRRLLPYSVGIVKAERHEPAAQCVYASRATLSRSPSRLQDVLAAGAPALVVIDECHEATAASYQPILEALRGRRILGLTATPTGALAKHFDLVYSYSLLDAIEDGCVVRPYVSDCKLRNLDLGRVAIARGDYVPADLERELVQSHVVEATVEALSRIHTAYALPFRDHTLDLDPRAGGVLVHTVSVAQAHATAEALKGAGWTAAVVWGQMKKAERRRLLEGYGTEWQVLCSPVALTQGVDLPYATTNVVARPTRSRRLFIQQTGRVLRPYDGKRGGLLIDLVGACRQHSIVSAPVLVETPGCERSADGNHVYLPLDDGGAVCEACGNRVRCWKRKGSHSFKAGTCTACGAAQCAASPDKHHHWIPWERGVKRCLHCTAEVRDRLYSLASVRNVTPASVAWLRLEGLPAEVWGVDLGKVGSLFNVRKGQDWQPIWVGKRGLQTLSPGPVTASLSRLLTDDVARQAVPVHGVYGVQPNRGASLHSKVRMLDLARRLRVWES